jgi:hypothetical protein
MIQRKYGVFVPSTVEFGGIVGIVEVVDCVKKHRWKWKFRDGWGWILAGRILIRFEYVAPVGVDADVAFRAFTRVHSDSFVFLWHATVGAKKRIYR